MPVNAKAVVDIEVDDKKFKSLQADMAKFQQSIANVRKDWQAMQKTQNDTLQVQQKMLQGLKQQGDAMRGLSAHAKNFAVHSESSVRHWLRISGHVKDSAFHVIDMTRKLASWGGILGAALTGFGLFGIGRVAGSITAGRSNGLAAGMSSGEMKALEAALGGGQYNLDISGMARASAAARETPYGPEAIAYGNFGVDPNQKGNKAIVQLLNRIRRGVRGGEFSPKEALDIYGAGNTGLDEAGIRSFSALSDDEARKQSKSALDTKAFDIPKDQERAWSDFYRYLNDFGEKINTIIGKHLTPILDVLKENGEAFLHTLEDFVTSGDFKRFMDELPGQVRSFVKILGSLTEALGSLLHMLGFLKTPEEMKAHQEFQKRQGDTMTGIQGGSGWSLAERIMGAQFDPMRGLGSAAEAIRGGWDWYKNTAPPWSPDMGSNQPNPWGRHQGGTDFIPKTGMYQLHQGEVVTSAAEVERLRQESNKYSIDDALRVVSGHESGNNYGIKGPFVPGQGRPYGKYQIMEGNIPQWTKQILGYSMTPDEFLRNPAAQDTVGRARFSQYVSRYGSIADAMSAWASGQPLATGADTRDAVFRHSTADYVRGRLAELAGGHYSPGGGGFRLDINDNTGANVNLVGAAMGLSPLPLFPL